MLRRAWALARDTVYGFIEDEAMTRGAAIACYTMFSIAPLLVVAAAIAGLVFGEEAVNDALFAQLRALVGREGAQAIQALVSGTDGTGAQGTGLPAAVSAGVLLLTASGVFAEIQAALNVIWRAVPQTINIPALVRARLLSIGLVAATGFLLLVSLLVSAVLSAVEAWARGHLPDLSAALRVASFAVSFILTAALFAAIYKILPDRRLAWRDVIVGAIGTALLFTIGKSLIGWYLGGSGLAGNYGAAGALVIVLLWVYYSAQVFLLGAEFTRSWAGLEGSHPRMPEVRKEPGGPEAAPPH